MKYEGLPEFLKKFGNEWLSAGEMSKLFTVVGNGVKKTSKNPETHSWVYLNKNRIKSKSIGFCANGKGEYRRYLVKSAWAVAKADGLEIFPTYKTSPVEEKIKFLEQRNAHLEQQVMGLSARQEIRVIHAKREFSSSDSLVLKLLVMASDPRPKPGVYFLVSDSHGITYIGQSKNVISRMSGHQSKDYDFARMIEIHDDSQRLEIEMRLIKLLEPRDNVMGLARVA